jgi:hypothetical protein
LSNIFGTRDSTKKKDVWNYFWQIFSTRDNKKNLNFAQEAEHQKHNLEHNVWTKESNAGRRAPRNTIYGTKEHQKHDLENVFGTRESTKKHQHQKEDFEEHIQNNIRTTYKDGNY